jgi:transposase
VPLVHPRGHAQADFGEAVGVIGGVERKIHFFAFDLPQSDAGFVVGYPAETPEAFCDGHVQAFAFFGGVSKSILYDNTKIAVAHILGDGKRQRTRVFSCGADVIARHPRSYEREDFVLEPLHYLALIDQKINALDQAASGSPDG